MSSLTTRQSKRQSFTGDSTAVAKLKAPPRTFESPSEMISIFGIIVILISVYSYSFRFSDSAHFYTVWSVGLLSTQSSLEIIPTRSAFRIPRLLQFGLRKPTRDIGFPDEFECKVNKIFYNDKHKHDILKKYFTSLIALRVLIFLHITAI